jgi:hypothetical protein
VYSLTDQPIWGRSTSAILLTAAENRTSREIKSCKKRLDAMSDEMTLALGAFVTEVGDVEYVMFETILAVAEEEPNEVHRAFYNETFGPKVAMLEKRWSTARSTSIELASIISFRC